MEYRIKLFHSLRIVITLLGSLLRKPQGIKYVHVQYTNTYARTRTHTRSRTNVKQVFGCFLYAE